MYLFLKELLISSFLGSFFWILLSMFHSISKRFFSQTWHYYTRLICTLCLLGFFKLISLVFKFFYPQKLFELNVTIPSNIANLTINYIPHHNTRLFSTFNFILFCFFITWFIGCIIFLFIKLKNYFKFRYLIQNTSQLYNIPNIRIPVKKNPFIYTPMLIGFIKPTIILPDIILDCNQLDFILKHELIHYRRKDTIIRFLVILSNAIHWFNPIVYQLNKSIYYFCETSCDELLVKNMKKKERKLYGQTILSMMELNSIDKPDIAIGLYENNKNIKHIKRRLSYMINYKKLKRSTLLASIIAASAIVASGGIVTYAITNTKIGYPKNEQGLSKEQQNDPDPVTDYSLPVYGDNGEYFGTYGEYIKNYPEEKQNLSEEQHNDPDPVTDYSLPVYGDNGEYLGTYGEYIENYPEEK